MSEDELPDGKLEMKVNQLIGLGETQRVIYDDLRKKGYVNGELLTAYQLHEKELQLLIKYQKYLTDS